MVPPQLVHFRQEPLRTMVNDWHVGHGSPVKPLSCAARIARVPLLPPLWFDPPCVDMPASAVAPSSPSTRKTGVTAG